MARNILPLAGVIAVMAGAVPAAAEAPERPDFTFRRIGVPPPGATRRITVQIDPEEQALWLASRPPLPPEPAPEPQGSPDAAPAPEGFWARLPAAAGAGAVTLDAALAALGPETAGPRLATLQAIARAHAADILRATVGTRVSPALVVAVIAVESGGQAAAQSPAGAVGLMQLMPATAERFGVSDRTDAGQSIAGGVAYLDWLMGAFDGDPRLVAAAYNAGENAVRAAGGVPDYAETRAYVPKLLAAWASARALCLTPPELWSDGCVFRVAAN